jgi:hypothetical protein
MRAFLNDKNLCNDKWLVGLVDAMDEVESLRPDDICRSAYVPAGLMAQLYGRTPQISRAQRLAASPYEFA